MQHALMRVWGYWREHDGGPIDLPHYEAVGTCDEQVLLRHAEEAMAGMDNAGIDLTEKIFRALTAIDAGNCKVRRPARLDEIEAITGESREKIMEVVERFRSGGRCFLVVYEDKTTGKTILDISHESLIRQWARLGAWVERGGG